MIHRKPRVLVVSCSLALAAAAALAVLYARHLQDSSIARACDGFDYRFVYEDHHLGMILKGGEEISPRVHPGVFRGCVRIDSVTPGANGSATVRGEIRLQSVIYGERRFSLDTTPWRPLLGFEATYGYPREGKMAWKFWEPDGTPVHGSLHSLLRNLCAPFAETASPGVYRSQYETVEAESGEQHVFWQQGVSPTADVVGWFLQPGSVEPDRIYALNYSDKVYPPRRTLSYRLVAVAIDPNMPATVEPAFDALSGE